MEGYPSQVAIGPVVSVQRPWSCDWPNAAMNGLKPAAGVEINPAAKTSEQWQSGIWNVCSDPVAESSFTPSQCSRVVPYPVSNPWNVQPALAHQSKAFHEGVLPNSADQAYTNYLVPLQTAETPGETWVPWWREIVSVNCIFFVSLFWWKPNHVLLKPLILKKLKKKTLWFKICIVLRFAS